MQWREMEIVWGHPVFSYRVVGREVSPHDSWHSRALTDGLAWVCSIVLWGAKALVHVMLTLDDDVCWCIVAKRTHQIGPLFSFHLHPDFFLSICNFLYSHIVGVVFLQSGQPKWMIRAYGWSGQLERLDYSHRIVLVTLINLQLWWHWSAYKALHKLLQHQLHWVQQNLSKIEFSLFCVILLRLSEIEECEFFWVDVSWL